MAGVDAFALDLAIGGGGVAGLGLVLLAGFQYFAHAASLCRRSLPASPNMPCGMNSVTRMNSRPSAYSHRSGKAPVNQLFRPLTEKAPMMGPSSVPRPPTAAQITISIEFPGDISDGLMMPTCGTYSAPAIPHSTADRVQTKSLNHSGL